MTIDIHNLLDSILDSLSRIEYIEIDKLPDIPLYMDQVTTFMEEELHASKRFEDDKILTKTMINNYAKNKLIPPPVNKKYSKEHLLTLVFIYYFKSVLSINDIQKLLHPVTERYFGNKTDLTLEDIYQAVFTLEGYEAEQLKRTIQDEFLVSEEAVKKLGNLDEDAQDYLQKFMFICLLNFDVYMKKLLIEKIIDSMNVPGKDDAPKNRRRKKD